MTNSLDKGDSGKAKRKLRIVLVISNLEFGGAQRQVVELANGLNASEFDVSIVSLSDFVPLARDLKNSATSLVVLKKVVKYDAILPMRLSVYLRQVQADIVHGFLFDAEIAVRLAGLLANVKVIIGSERNCQYRIKKIQRVVYRLTKKLQTSCIANSFAGAQFNSEMLGYPMVHYDVLHNGVDTRRFFPLNKESVLERLHLDKTFRYVGIFGSFKQQKNHEMFFRAAAKIIERCRDVRFLVVGDQLHGGMHGSTEYKNKILRTVGELGLNSYCVFVGNTDDVVSHYNVCEMTMLSSLFEGFPNVVLESLSCGIPVIATRVSDNHLLIPESVAGHLVELGDVQAMADRAISLLEDAEKRNTMSANARQWIMERFSVEAMARKAEMIYRSRCVIELGHE